MEKIKEFNKYVYAYEHEGVTYFWKFDDVYGDEFCCDVEYATIMSEKQTELNVLGDSFFIGEEIWCEDIKKNIVIEHELLKIEV
jgi:hypothetical protein